MVRGAQRLPVAPAPEQRLIPAMRRDVVHHRGRSDQTLGLAHHAQGMLTQELGSRLLPLVAVAALGRSLLAGAPAAGLHRGHTPGVQHRQRRLEGLQLGHGDRCRHASDPPHMQCA